MNKEQFTNEVLAAEKSMYCIAKTILKNDEDCADAMQNAILNAYSQLDSLRDDKYFKTWLTRILINESYAMIRKKKETISYEEYMKEESTDHFSGESGVYMEIQKLNEKYRIPFVLHYIEGFTAKEIAKMLKSSEAGIKMRLLRARKNFAETIEFFLSERSGIMQKKEWRNKMPEVPQNVHQAVIHALDSLDCTEEKKDYEVISMSRCKNKKKTIVAALLAATMIGTTVFAGEFLWDKKTIEKFNNPSEEIQKTFLDNGVTTLPGMSVTDNGITVSIVQALQDENCVCLVMKIEAEEEIVGDGSWFKSWGMYTEDNRKIGSNCGASLIGNDISLKKENYFVMQGMKDGMESSGGKISVRLSDFWYGIPDPESPNDHSKWDEHEIEGEWNFELEFEDVSGLTKTIPINQTVEANGVPVMMNYVKVSPLSSVVSCNYEDVEKIPPIIEGDRLVNDGLGYYDQVEYVTSDGERFHGGGGIGSSDVTSDGEYISLHIMDHVVDPEQLEKVILGMGQLEVEIK